MSKARSIADSAGGRSVHRPPASSQDLLGLEVAVGARGVELGAESASNGRDGHGHVLGSLRGLVPADVAVSRVDEALTGGIDMRRTGWIVALVERELALRDRDEHGPRMLV